MDRPELYLDTHVLVWLYAQGLHGFNQQTIALLDSATYLLISPMVMLEIEYLHEVKKITRPSSVIVQYLAEKIDLTVCEKSFHQVAVQALEMIWTRDPFDRLITAQASLDHSPLLTKDRIIHQYYPHAVWYG
ncbi:MAG: PIN domain-containing protein [Desulfovermiculus sp.]|nr:PIN domain-containing protein [Desulfovermiculus sp.]